jgi:hypothetical protein
MTEQAQESFAAVNEKGSPGSERRLVYIPIVHTMADMGTLGPSLLRAKMSAVGRFGVARTAVKIEKLWSEIERIAAGLPIELGAFRVYQDGLPVCSKEQKIVSEVAESGSRNYRLLLSLQARGAILMGTESPELLLEEHKRTKADLAPARRSHAPASRGASGMRPGDSEDTLLKRRDLYIADRINTTLLPGETGILFIGMAHDTARYLNPDIAVTFPLRSTASK